MTHERFFTAKEQCKFELIDPAKDAAQPNPLTQSVQSLPTLSGYAIVWNAISSDRGGYVARMKPGSAKLSKDGVIALFNHDTGQILGNTANGTLKLEPDDYGLKVTIKPPNTQSGRDVAELVKNGYVGGMSFGMLPETFQETQENGQLVRDYTAYTVDEVTVSPIPAFVQTSIDAMYSRKRGAEFQTLDQQLLRLARLSTPQTGKNFSAGGRI